MDTRTLINNLNNIFCELKKEGRVYSKVWLDPVDFGGLYNDEKYILNVKALHKIETCGEEIDFIIYLLDKKAKEELSYIWRVSVYHENENTFCQSEDLVVFEEQNSCP